MHGGMKIALHILFSPVGTFVLVSLVSAMLKCHPVVGQAVGVEAVRGDGLAHVVDGKDGGEVQKGAE